MARNNRDVMDGILALLDASSGGLRYPLLLSITTTRLSPTERDSVWERSRGNATPRTRLTAILNRLEKAGMACRVDHEGHRATRGERWWTTAKALPSSPRGS